MINYLCKPRCVSVTTSVKLFGLYCMFFCNVVAPCLIWVSGILLSFALILCVSLMLSCVIIFKNMSNQFVHMMNFRWSAQGFYPMPCQHWIGALRRQSGESRLLISARRNHHLAPETTTRQVSVAGTLRLLLIRSDLHWSVLLDCTNFFLM